MELSHKEVLKIKEKMSFRCVCCGKNYELDIDPSKLEEWRNGALIQKAFPDLEPKWRELIISGICPECWEKTFGSEEDDV